MNNLHIWENTSSNSNVGAVIVNWNSYEVLGQCLFALTKQTLNFSRVVVVDNGSHPQFEDLTCARPENTEYIKLPGNTGFARANNIAFEMLQDCEWIALVNPDAFLEPDWLEKMVSGIHRFPGFSFFSGLLIQANNRSYFDGLGDVYHTSGLAWKDAHAWGLHQRSPHECEIFSPCAAAAIYKREALQEVGGFDEDYFCYYEDVDLGFRLRLAGHRCMLLPRAVAHHVGSATAGGENSSFVIYHGHRNLVWTYIKNMPGVFFWLYLPQHCLLNLYNIFHLIFRRKGCVILRAKINAIQGIPVMWRKRAMIQANKKVPASAILKQMAKGFGSIISRTPPGI
ncbi:MAG: glycosyltransferase family 2 protein [Nitrospirales bacterium]